MDVQTVVGKKIIAAETRTEDADLVLYLDDGSELRLKFGARFADYAWLEAELKDGEREWTLTID